MSPLKLQKLFDSARNDAPPAPPPDFPAQVLRAIRRAGRPVPATLLDQLGGLFPRLALGAALMIGLCLAADFCVSTFDQSGLVSGAARLSEQWLFTVKGF